MRLSLLLIIILVHKRAFFFFLFCARSARREGAGRRARRRPREGKMTYLSFIFVLPFAVVVSVFFFFLPCLDLISFISLLLVALCQKLA